MYRDTISTKAMVHLFFFSPRFGQLEYFQIVRTHSLRSMNQGTIFQGLGSYEHWGRWTIRCHPGGWWVAWMVANHVGKFWGVSGGVCPFAKKVWWEHDDWWCIIYDVYWCDGLYFFFVLQMTDFCFASSLRVVCKSLQIIMWKTGKINKATAIA